MLNSYDDEYFEVVDKVSNSIEDISNVIVERRYEQVKDLANSELQKGK
jgi:putative ABC transport system permease protein